MTKAIYAGPNTDQRQNRIDKFKLQGIQITPATSGDMAYAMIQNTAPDLLITEDPLKDMSAKNLIEKAVEYNPFLNCVVISTLSHDEFHEKFEGLGVLMQLPYDLHAPDIKNLNDHLEKITRLFT